MASRIVVDRITLKTLQKYHHAVINTFGENETLVEAISSRPGFLGTSPIGYLSLIARRRESRLNDLEEALINDKSLLRVSAFRGMLLILNSSDYSVYFRALYPYLKNHGMNRNLPLGLSPKLIARTANYLSESQFERPRTIDSLAEIMYRGRQKRLSAPVENFLLRKMCDLGVLIRIANKGWKGNEFSYALVEKWIPDIKLRSDNPESARTETVRRYLKCYGPATLEDISWWTGFSSSQVTRSISHLRREAVRFIVESYKDELFGLRETVDAIRVQREAQNTVHFLPPLDLYTQGWKSTQRLHDKEYAPWIFDQRGNSASVILIDGKVVGLWQLRDLKTNIFEYHVFKNYKSCLAEVVNAAEHHAMIISGVSGAHQIYLVERELPEPIDRREPRAFFWPLGKKPHAKRTQGLFTVKENSAINTFRQSYLDNQHLIRPQA